MLLTTFLLLFLPTSWMHRCAAAALEESLPRIPEVKTQNGTIQGIYNPEYHQDHFLGVPFAQPPVGELRFSHPKSLKSTWKRPYLAHSYGAFCQGNTINLSGFSQSTISYPEDEDCLTLNIIRPSGYSQSPGLPVLVWIHGGGFQEGGSGDARYDMSHLVKTSVDMEKPIIGISINYRLGVFGFIAGQPFRDRGATNLGLQDQRLALRWIQENVRSFGGDPSRVTVQGESAGAASIGFHLLANNGRDEGLFHRAIAQSGGPFYPLPFASNATQDLMLESLANTTGCSGHDNVFSCLQSIPAAELKTASALTVWNPVIDFDLISGLPSVALNKGQFNRVPMLIGANTNEGTPFLPFVSKISARTDKDFDDALLAVSGKNLPLETRRRFQELYLKRDKITQQHELGAVLSDPGEPYGPLYGPVSLLTGDYTLVAGRRIAAESWARCGVASYSYRFNTVPAGVSPQILGAAHFQEIPFVFRNIQGKGHERDPFDISDPGLRSKYLHLSEIMSRMWLSFVNTGSPNSHGSSSGPPSDQKSLMLTPRSYETHSLMAQL